MAKAENLLYLDGVSVSFDGFKALNNLSFLVGRNEMRAIIGPNGAGKTTMMDVITGKTRPDEGTLRFDGRIDLTAHDEAEIAGFGIGRKFQKPTVFENQSVRDNLKLALKAPRGPFATLFHRDDEAQRTRIDQLLATIRLRDRETDLAMTELFGGLSPVFYEAYWGAWPMAPGYREIRRPLYQLYHLLNHARLFGGHYVGESQRVMQQLIALV